ncbi:MAG: PAS domain S-box protein, partial [Methanosarcinales archaeon]
MAKANIMVVEDENIVAMDIKNILKSLGYGVSAVVSSGAEAIKKASETHPDLVLMDIWLKGDIDGVEAAEQIKVIFDIPVVYITAYADDNTLHRAKITEPYGYILKPFEEKELHTTIEIALYKHKMESKLKENEKWLATTLKSIGDAVIATDTKGYVTFLNPVAEALTGWKNEEGVGKLLKEVFNIINEETGKPAENPVKRILQEGVVVELGNNIILIAKDGTKLPIEDSCAPIKDDRGKILGTVLVFRDITERKKAEEELRNSKEFIETIFNSIKDSISVIDTTNFRIVRVNKAFLNILNMEEKDVIGKYCYEVIHQRSKPCEPPNDTCPLAETLKTGYHSSAEHIHYDKNGREIYVEVSTSPIRNEKGEIHQVVHIARNITEKKQMEAKLIQSAKMASIGELAAGVAHNLRSPLAAVKGYPELVLYDLKNGELEEDSLKEIMQNIIDSTKKAFAIINTLFEFSRLSEYKEVVNIKKVIENTEELIGPQLIKNKIKIIKNIKDYKVYGNENQLIQVFINILLNAKDAMPEGGEVHITSKTKGEYVEIKVRDT